MTAASRITSAISRTRFFLINFLVTMSVYGLAIFVYPSDARFIPRICLIWASPFLGTLVALLVTKVSLIGRSLGASALAMLSVSLIYCAVYQEKSIIETLKWATLSYFLPGAIVALLLAILAKRITN